MFRSNSSFYVNLLSLTLLLCLACTSRAETPVMDLLAQSNVVWSQPSADSSGSMPLGNGDISLNCPGSA